MEEPHRRRVGPDVATAGTGPCGEAVRAPEHDVHDADGPTDLCEAGDLVDISQACSVLERNGEPPAEVMGVEFMPSKVQPGESTTVAPTSGKVTKPLRRVVALAGQARPADPAAGEANVVSRPSSRGSGLTTSTRSRPRSTCSRSSPRSHRPRPAAHNPAARSGRPSRGGCDRRAQVRHLDEDRLAPPSHASSNAASTASGSIRRPPGAGGRPAELRSDGAPSYLGPPVHRPRGWRSSRRAEGRRRRWR